MEASFRYLELSNATILFCDQMGPGVALTTALTKGVNLAGHVNGSHWPLLSVPTRPLVYLTKLLMESNKSY